MEDSPVDIFEPAAYFIASGGLGIVWPSNSSNLLRFTEPDGTENDLEIDVGDLVEVSVSSDRLAVLGKKALQLFDSSATLVKSIRNTQNFTCVAFVEATCILATNVGDNTEFYQATEEGDLTKLSTEQITPELLDIAKSKHWSCGDIKVADNTHIAFGENVYELPGTISCLAKAQMSNTLAIGTKEKVLILTDGGIVDYAVRNSPLALGFYDDDESVYFCHSNGISQVELHREPTKIETTESSQTNQEPSYIWPGRIQITSESAESSEIETPREGSNESDFVSRSEHEQTVKALQARIDALAKLVDTLQPDSKVYKVSQTPDPKVDSVKSVPKSLKEAFQLVFAGERPYYYFQVHHEELEAYITAAKPSTAQLLRLVLIEAFPSSGIADKLVKDLGERQETVNEQVYNAALEKYHVYEVYK